MRLSGMIHQVVVDTKDGVAMTRIAWNYDNPSAGRSEPLPGTLEALRVDSGLLVAEVGYEALGPVIEDGGLPMELLVRGVVVCDAAMTCREFIPKRAIRSSGESAARGPPRRSGAGSRGKTRRRSRWAPMARCSHCRPHAKRADA